jgi:hypothetical protein
MMQRVEDSIEAIMARNKRVEAEKAWEVSLTRRGFLSMLIYLTTALFLWIMNEVQFLILPLIPAIGYLFSTLTLPPLKRWWMKIHAANGDA